MNLTPSEDPYTTLGQALATVIEDAVYRGVHRALAERDRRPPPAAPSQEHQPPYVNVAKAARRLGLTNIKVYKLIYTGKLPHIRIGRTVGVPVKALEEWMNKSETND